MTIRIKHVDKTVAGAGGIVVFLRVLLCVGYKQIAIDVLDTEGRIPRRNGRVGEPAVGGRQRIGTAGPVGENTSIVPARKFVAKRKAPLTLTANTSALYTAPLAAVGLAELSAAMTAVSKESARRPTRKWSRPRWRK